VTTSFIHHMNVRYGEPNLAVSGEKQTVDSEFQCFLLKDWKAAHRSNGWQTKSNQLKMEN